MHFTQNIKTAKLGQKLVKIEKLKKYPSIN